MKQFKVKIVLETKTELKSFPDAKSVKITTNTYQFSSDVLTVDVFEVTRIFKSLGYNNSENYGFGISDFIECATSIYKDAQEVEEGIFKYLEQYDIIFDAKFYNNKIVFVPVHPEFNKGDFSCVVRESSLD